MRVRFIDNLDAVTPDAWNAIAGSQYPFLQHRFLHALEASGSVSAQRGWQPQHLLVEDEQTLLAVMPLYIKQHSMGEYVFDHSWASAYQRHGLHYYPKLVSAIPFTPAGGPRLSIHADCNHTAVMQAVMQALQTQCAARQASSWHVLFPDESESQQWLENNALERLGCQFHWHNRHFTDFDDFLSTFVSRKRKEVKRERRRVTDQGIHIMRFTGDAITSEHWQAFYRFYQLTNLKYNGHGGYLTERCFDILFNNLRDEMMLAMAFDETGNAIAGALNIIGSDTLYGRYWGCDREVEYLHFELCYYQGIDFCIEQGLQRFDPGAQGEHKIARGFRPVITRSFHEIQHPSFRSAVADFLKEESIAVRHYQQRTAESLPFKQTTD